MAKTWESISFITPLPTFYNTAPKLYDTAPKLDLNTKILQCRTLTCSDWHAILLQRWRHALFLLCHAPALPLFRCRRGGTEELLLRTWGRALLVGVAPALSGQRFPALGSHVGPLWWRAGCLRQHIPEHQSPFLVCECCTLSHSLSLSLCEWVSLCLSLSPSLP
jgi:hypothetical protein